VPEFFHLPSAPAMLKKSREEHQHARACYELRSD
jgi:hypothetical protein